MEPVFEIKRERAFDLEEAKRVSQLLFRVTQKKSQRIESLIHRLQLLPGGDAQYTALENQIDLEIREWEGKVERLGGIPRGLWMADFDSGSGYYCWRYPETEVDHWHGYQEGFSNRVCLSGARSSESVEIKEDASRLLQLQEMK